jgi:hypothetical protein
MCSHPYTPGPCPFCVALEATREAKKLLDEPPTDESVGKILKLHGEAIEALLQVVTPSSTK